MFRTGIETLQCAIVSDHLTRSLHRLIPCEEAIDGRIELDSAPGKGTRVRIVLERARVREAVVA